MSAIGNPRVLLACLIAPITTGLILFFISAFANIGEGFWALKMSAVVGYPAMIILGFPAYLVLHKLRWTGLTSYVCMGFVVGLVVVAIIFSPIGTGNLRLTPVSAMLSPSFAGILLLAALFGALSSAVFWLITRPDHGKE